MFNIALHILERKKYLFGEAIILSVIKFENEFIFNWKT